MTIHSNPVSPTNEPRAPKVDASLVVLRSTSRQPVADTVRECMELCNWQDWVGRNSKVVIKPNLCTAIPEKVEMADTSVEVTEAVCRVLSERTRRIAVGESDGLHESADHAFEAAGYTRLAETRMANLVNLSREPRVRTACPPAGEIELPRLLLEADVIITLPVLKTHALTYFTGGLKNQWGCLPQHDRILFHRWLDPMLVSLHRILRPALSLMDALVGMEGRGPTNGKPRRLNLLLASRDTTALDVTAMRLVGLDPHKARHVQLAAKEGLGKIDAREISIDGEWEKYRTTFEPAILDQAIRAMNFMSRYRWFVKYALEQDRIFYPVRSLVQQLRRAGIVEGG